MAQRSAGHQGVAWHAGGHMAHSLASLVFRSVEHQPGAVTREEIGVRDWRHAPPHNLPR